MSANNYTIYINSRTAHFLRRIVVKDTVPKKTGELAKSITVTVAGGGHLVATNKIYARMVHFGSNKPVTIVPRRKKVLYWKTSAPVLLKSGGVSMTKSGKIRMKTTGIFARKVVLYKDKPRKANPFFKIGVEILQKRVVKEADQVYPDLLVLLKRDLVKQLSHISPDISVK